MPAFCGPSCECLADDPHAGALEVTPEWVAYQRRYRLGTEGAWWAVPFDAALGLTYAGARDLGGRL